MIKKLSVLVLSLFIAVSLFLAHSDSVFAQASPATATSSTSLSESAVVQGWTPDSEVTFAGKIAARSSNMLDLIIDNYKWADFPSKSNPFNTIWIMIRNIVYALMSLFILAGAFLLIITRGQSITVKKFIPRFILIILLVTLSFSLIQVLYNIGDVVEVFFLRKPNTTELIKSKDLLNISFDYKSFKGFRRVGAGDELYQYEESAFISLLLVKLTAATYYVMTIILIIRKVILWFFIIVSPIFPLLLFFAPIRNTAKIWIGEFFRWLLYGPLFAVFLAGLVSLWQSGLGGVPLNDLNKPCGAPQDDFVYPTAINILLGGPCQVLAFDPTGNKYNNINVPQSFMQYVVALLMLWMVILMPFILLKIFLDYLKTVDLQDNRFLNYVMQNRPKSPPPPNTPKSQPHFVPVNPITPKTPPPLSPLSAGAAKQIPTEIRKELQRDIEISRSMANLKSSLLSNQQTQSNIAQVLQATKLKIFSMKDVAKMETGMISKNATTTNEYNRVSESLSRISGTSTITTPQEQQQFIQLKAKLEDEAKKGNPVAKGIVEAAKDPKQANVPEENEVQQVSLEDYEEVRKTWIENYRNLEPPNGEDRKAWLTEEVRQIPQAIDLMMSGDPQKQAQGKEMVKQILPFLLLGGFSKMEIVTYLKAKLEAAKTVLDELAKTEKDEDSQVYVERKAEEKPKTMTAEAEIPGSNQPQTPQTAEGLKVEQTPDPDKKV